MISASRQTRPAMMDAPPDLSQQKLDYFPGISFLREIALPKFKKMLFFCLFHSQAHEPAPSRRPAAAGADHQAAHRQVREKEERKKKYYLHGEIARRRQRASIKIFRLDGKTNSINSCVFPHSYRAIVDASDSTDDAPKDELKYK